MGPYGTDRNQTVELREYSAVIWKRLWLILLCTAVAAFASWFVVRDQPAQYQTSTTLIIGNALEKSDPTYRDFDISGELGRTYSELIKLEPILKATAAALGFEDDWPMLRGAIGVDLVPGTLLIKIRATDTEPLRAKLIADETARQLIANVGASASSTRYQEFIATQADSFPPKVEAAQAEIQRLEAELSNAFGARQIQELQGQIDSLERQIRDWQITFADYQSLLGEGRVNILTVLEEAPMPRSPIGSGAATQILLAAAIGCSLAVGASFLMEYLDDTIKTPEDVSKSIHITTVGSLPRISGDQASERIITARHPRSPTAEAFRVVRTNLQFSSLDHPLKSLVVTSPNPAEGKSTIVVNLAVVMAQAGSSVILVDSDLRRPRLHNVFHLSNARGLTQALLQVDPVLGDELQESGLQNLSILTSGPLPPNPSELLGSKKMRTLVQDLTELADIVLFDSPPVLPVTDAVLLAKQTDGVLLIIDSGKTRRVAARQAIESLRQVECHIVGVVLNRLASRAMGGYQVYYASDADAGDPHIAKTGFKQKPLLERLATLLGLKRRVQGDEF